LDRLANGVCAREKWECGGVSAAIARCTSHLPPPTFRFSFNRLQVCPFYRADCLYILARMDPKSEATTLSGDSCALCEQTERPANFCVDCGLSFCESCWSTYPSHAPGVVNSHVVPHEKIDRAVAFSLKQILTPPSDPEVQRRLHENDAQTAWFGVARDASGAPVLQDYGRYSTIMHEGTVGEFSQRWPQLVSFVGQTGGFLPLTITMSNC